MPEQLENSLPILLVEDNEIDVEITRRVLAKSGSPVRLLVARDGHEALDLLLGEDSGAAARTLPRLILLDLRLPTIDGRDVLRRLKSDPQLCAIPVVVVTSEATDHVMHECVELGTNMYFVKPITPSDASNVINTVEKYWALLENVMSRTA